MSPAAAILLPAGLWLFVALVTAFFLPMIVASAYSLAYACSHRLDAARG